MILFEHLCQTDDLCTLAVLPEGHVDEIVDTATDGEAEVTEGPEEFHPVGVDGAVLQCDGKRMMLDLIQ